MLSIGAQRQFLTQFEDIEEFQKLVLLVTKNQSKRCEIHVFKPSLPQQFSNVAIMPQLFSIAPSPADFRSISGMILRLWTKFKNVGTAFVSEISIKMV